MFFEWGKSTQFLVMAIPSVWGPVLWSILHSLACRAGKGTSLIKCKEDELRELVWLFTHLESIVSCVECKKHIEEYRKANSLPSVATGFEDWLWTFHEAVNQRLGKPPGPPKESVRMQGVDCTKAFGLYKEIVKDSMLTGTLKGYEMREWRRHLFLLNACY